VLDLADGQSDGVPLLPAGLSRATWLGVLEPQFEAFVRRVEAAEASEGAEEMALDPYGASGIDEFFAVASESFFVNPHGLAAEHGPLYTLLSQLYQQDPKAHAPGLD
jgi:MtfA peptidase